VNGYGKVFGVYSDKNQDSPNYFPDIMDDMKLSELVIKGMMSIVWWKGI
jgi:hypothetical protein